MNANPAEAVAAGEFPAWEQVDTGPLSWVMSELRESLDRSLESLRAFSQNHDDSTALRLAKSNLHQAHGALQIVNLEGVSLITEEVESLLESFETDPSSCTAAAVDGVVAAYRAVTEYLEELLAGAPHQPVRLFPSYKTLLTLRHADRIHPADLFYPDLSIRPPKESSGSGRLLAPAEIAQQRSRFERALLQYLRNPQDTAAATEMCGAVTLIESSPKQGQQRAFWWVTRAFFEALSASAVPSDLNVKRLCARINLQIRRLLDGSGTVAERLVRDTLFFVARSKPVTAHIAEVKRVYALDNSLPEDFETERYGRLNFAALRAAKEALAGAKTAWSLVVAGDAGQIQNFAKDSSALLTSTGTLGRPGLSSVAQVVASIGTELSFDPRKPGEGVGLDVATALLFLEGALEQARSLDEAFDERAAAVVARVESSAVGNVVEADEVPWLDEISRQAQERLTMASFVAEMQSNLRTIEKTLDAFFRDPTQRADLPQAEKLLSQIGGALSVLGHEQAGQAIEKGREAIRKFNGEGYTPDPQEFERVAESLGAVGFYVESLQHRTDLGTVFRYDAQTGTFSADMARGPTHKKVADEEPDPDPNAAGPAGEASPSGPESATAEVEEQDSSVEKEIAEHGENVARLAHALREDPGNAAAREALSEALRRMQQDALLVDDIELKERAAQALKVLHDVQTDNGEGLTASVFELTDQTHRFGAAWDNTATAPLPEVTAPVPEHAEEIDAELLEVFLSEAVEVLDTARGSLETLAANPSDREALTTIRRAFHTLKGSGRMVGLKAFGEAGWGIEQTLNQWLSDQRPVTGDLQLLLKRAIPELDAWVAELSQSGHSQRTPDRLIAMAAAVREGRPLMALLEAEHLARPDDFDSQVTEVLGDEPLEIASEDLMKTEVMPRDGLWPGRQVDSDDMIEPLLPESTTQAPGPEPVFGSLEMRAARQAAQESVAQPEEQLPELPPVPAEPLATRAVADPFSDEPVLEELTAVLPVEPSEEGMPTLEEALRFPEAAPPVAGVANDESIGDEDAAFQVTPVPEPLPKPLQADVLIVPSQPRQDEYKQIGDLTLSVPLYNIYLSEADELLRRLAHDFGEWRHEISRNVSEAAVRAAHSLAGTSATVGLIAVHDLAHTLEAVLQALHRTPTPVTLDEVGLLQDAVDGLRSMLHRFATGLLPDADLQLMEALAALREAVKLRHEASILGEGGLSRLPEAGAPTRTEISSAWHPDEPDFGDVGFEEEPLPAPVEAQLVVDEPLDQGAADVAHDAAPLEHRRDSADQAPTQHPGEDEFGAPFVAPVVVAHVAAGGPTALTTFAPLAPQTVAEDRAAQHVQHNLSLESLGHVRDELDPELIQVFLQEASDYLPQIGEALRRWQSDPTNMMHPQALMRQMHTVKGSARMAGAMRLGELVHNMETRVESAVNLREIPSAAFEELLAAHDRLMEIYERLMNPSSEPEPVAEVQQEAVELAAAPDGIEPAEAAASEPAFPLAATPQGTAQAFAAPRPAAAALLQQVQAVRVRADVLDRLVNQAGEVSISRSRLENEVGHIKTSLSDLTENLTRLRGQLREIEIQAETQMQSQLSLAKERERFDPLEFDRFTRLQELTRMMAESVNDVATVHQNLLRSLDGANRDLLAQQRMTRDLQQDLMRVRMVPFSSVTERLYRVVRQTAKELDKRVNLDIRGGGVEIDRGVLERMVAPFEHLLRNAIVHGIESRAARIGAGKSDTGELLVEVRQEGNEIVLVFSDDGAGLNLARIRDKGRQVGLFEANDEVSDARAADLIFHPGFTTAAEVTELAGRGVGMDVVRAEAGGLGGRVSVDTVPGRGTRFTINLPLTLAVTQVVLVSVGGRTFALPSVLVEQVQQLRPQPLAQAYNDGHINWLGQPVKLHFLAGLLGERDRSPIAQRYSPVLILRSGGERIAVHVDEVQGNQEVVVKNIGPQLARMVGVAGATVLGSGDIVLILNPVQLAQQIDRERPHVQAPAEVGGAIAELIEEPPAPTRVEAVSGLETLPIVMVVDDSLTVRRVTQRLLTREGYQVVLAKDGVDALQQLQDYTPHVMLVDIEMPRMDGFDLTRNIRGDDRYQDIPIIMITSRTADKHRSFALELGVNVYLGKPYQEEELLHHLSHFVAERKRARA